MLLLSLSCGWLLGVGIGGRWGSPTPAPLLLLLALGLGLLGLTTGERGRRGLALALLALAAGWIRGGRAHAALPAPLTDRPLRVRAVGVVKEDPTLTPSGVRVDLDLEGLAVGTAPLRPLQARLRARLPFSPTVAYGDRIQVEGTLEPPPHDGGFDYAAYLARKGIRGLLRGRRVRVLTPAGPSPLGLLYRWRGRLREALRRHLPEPEASLAVGILLGDEGTIPRDVEEAYARSGLSHVVAISGYNIALVVGWMERGLGRLRGGTLGILGGILVYTLLVGGGGAVVRAAAMGALAVLARRSERAPDPILTLLLATDLLTLQDPWILWDPGFQLSALATLGLVAFGDPLLEGAETLLRKGIPSPLALFPRRDVQREAAVPPGEKGVPEGVRAALEPVVLTLAAQIPTLPILASGFGQVSWASLPANLLAEPAVTGAMFWGGLVAGLDLIHPALARPVAWIAWAHLAWITAVARTLARLPGGVWTSPPWPEPLVWGYFALILAAGWRWSRSR